MSDWSPFYQGRRYFLLLALGLLLLGAAGVLFWGQNRSYALQQIVLPLNESARQLRASLYRPRNAAAAGLPALVLVHGVQANRQYMDFFARLLVRRGLFVLSLDLGGHGESDPRPVSEAENLRELQAALAWLRQFAGVDNQRIALAGHSMGGTVALQALEQDASLRGAVILGMTPDPALAIDCRSWFGIGLYESFHPPARLRQRLKSAACSIPLWISAAASHQSEMTDPLLLLPAAEWLEHQLQHPSAESGLSEFWLDLALQLYLLAWLGLVLWLLWRPEHSWGELILLTLGLGVLLLLPSLRLLEPLPTSGLCLFWLALISLRKALSPAALQTWKIWGLLGGAVWLSWEAVALVHALAEWLRDPGQLRFLPFFLLQELRVLPLTLIQTLRPWFFEEYTLSLLPAWPLAIGVALEWFWPGWLVTGLRSCSCFLARCLTETAKPSLPRLAYGLLGGLLLGGLYGQLAARGFLHAQAWEQVWQMGFLRLFPVFVGAALLARIGLQKTGACPRDDSNVRPTI